ncbi:hypothetical protein [Pedobacter sp.]|uniref:hypothetical protein n=1 Tax=Pedobacter sp. TaxID=1411316 RepID=UPI003BA97255
MKVIYLFLFICFSSFTNLSAQETTNYYKGLINNKPVRLYLKQQTNDCGAPDIYSAIYQYGNGKNWIELHIQTNNKGNFAMTEYLFTGVLILNKKQNILEGVWISPDNKTHFKVVLNKQSLPAKLKEIFEEALERTHYENYDC